MWFRKQRVQFIDDAVDCGYTRTDAISWWHSLYSKAIRAGNGSAKGSDSGERDADTLWLKLDVITNVAEAYDDERCQDHSSSDHSETNVRVESANRVLTYLCRHGALREGYDMDEIGGILVRDLLQYHERVRRERITANDVRRAVTEAHIPVFERQYRLKLYVDDDNLERVRALHGHDKEVGAAITDELAFTPMSYSNRSVCCYGTYHNRWRIIRTHGLNSRHRKHIHFADHVLTTSECDKEIVIILNVKRWLDDHGMLFKTESNLVLTPGFNGTVPPEYFLEVRQIRPEVRTLLSHPSEKRRRLH